MKVVQPSHDSTTDTVLFDKVIDFLLRHEAANSILLAGLWEHQGFQPDVLMLVAIDAQNEVTGVAVQGGTFLMVLSAGMSDDAADAVLRYIFDRNIQIPGVMGPTALVEHFARRWERVSSGSLKPGMPQRILQTSSVMPPSGIEGSARSFTADDQELLYEWFTWFALDAEGARGEQAQRAAMAMIKRFLATGGGMFWLDGNGKPVSLACYKGRTPNGLRIGPVFTPKKYRRHGYGAAVTAAVTRQVLDQGLQFACLYTDAGNSTANHIYESIGYRFVADSMQYRFNWSTYDDDYDD
jgi:RimJ/RimL family protein N-acetyltransferase